MRNIKNILLGLFTVILCCQSAGCQTTGIPTSDTTDSSTDEPTVTVGTPTMAATSTSTTVKKEEPDIVVGYADLTHDGVKEKLAVNLSGLEDNTSYQATLYVYTTGGTVLWKGTVGTSHAGEDSYYLYTNDGEEYLMEYDPHINMGVGNYSYTIFGLFDNGTKNVISSQQIEFSVSAPVFHYDIAELLSFYNNVNSYLGKSYLLLSSLPQDVFANNADLPVNSVAYSTETKKLTGRETYDDLLGMDSPDKNKPMKDRLEKYRKDLLKEKQENQNILSSSGN